MQDLMGKCWLAREQRDVVSQQRVVEACSAVQTAVSVMQPVKAEWRAAQVESQRPGADNGPRMLKPANCWIRTKQKHHWLICAKAETFAFPISAWTLLTFKNWWKQNCEVQLYTHPVAYAAILCHQVKYTVLSILTHECSWKKLFCINYLPEVTFTGFSLFFHLLLHSSHSF